MVAKKLILYRNFLRSNLQGNFVGCLWMLMATLLFTIMIALIKHVGQTLNVFQIIFVRQFIMVLIIAPTIFRHMPNSLRTQFPGLHTLRVILASIAMLAGFYAVIHLPIAEATAIGFSRSFFITILAIFVLNEFVGIHRWGATIIGFIGVIIILRPTGEDALNIYGLLAVLGASAAGGVMITIRKLAQHESATTILTYQAIFVGLIMAIPTIWLWKTPNSIEFLLLIAIGIVSWAAQMCNIKAQQFGEAAVLASLDYLRLIYAGIIGWLIFSEIPDTAMLIGTTVIVLATIYTMIREIKKRKTITTINTNE